jgi:hypothetical protein
VVVLMGTSRGAAANGDLVDEGVKRGERGGGRGDGRRSFSAAVTRVTISC